MVVVLVVSNHGLMLMMLTDTADAEHRDGSAADVWSRGGSD